MTPAEPSAEGVEPPYYAVIFTSERTAVEEDYEETTARMEELARKQPGFLGLDSFQENGLGITVSYWADEAAVLAWKDNEEHRRAQDLGMNRWYRRYWIRIAKVEREYGSGDAEVAGHSRHP